MVEGGCQLTAQQATQTLYGVSAHQSAGTPFQLPAALTAAAVEVLELVPVLDLVAGFAAGPLGADRVRSRRPTTDAAWIGVELERVAELLRLLDRGDALDAVAVSDLGRILPRLRLEGSVLEGLELTAIHRTLSAARQAGADLRRIAPDAPRAAELRAEPLEASLEKRLGECVDETGELLDSASPALLHARREVHAARERLVRKLETILHGLDASGGGSVTLRNGRYVIPVRRDARSRPDGIVHDESASAGTLFIEPGAAVELGNALRAAQTAADREALRVLRELTDRLRPHAAGLAAAQEMCVALDDLVARARYAHGVRAAVPAVRPPGRGLALREARHPLLLGRGVAVVPFDLELDEGEYTLLISGPNTGGKTVLLKTLGLAALLVQSGVVPPLGPGSALPVFGRIVADIGDHQSIAADLSTFSAHVATLRAVLDEADDATLVLIDEIGSGTDPAEGAALAAAALQALTLRRARTVATTHLGALKALAAETKGIVNGSLQFDAERIAPTYRFTKGPPGRSYGLAIARRLGVRADVLADAESRVSDDERALDALLEAAEARERHLAAAQAELTVTLAEAERETARLAMQATIQAERDRDLRAREKEAERKGRTEARRFLLAAREEVEQALQAAAAASDEDAAREARRRLEEAIRREGEALAEPPEPEPAAVSNGALEPGGRVRLASGGTGELVEIRGDGKAVVRAGAVKLVVAPESLTPLAGAAPKEPRRAAMPAADAGASPVEIDLRGLRADEAEAATVAALDAAILAENPYLRIIHGMGTGVVRERVRRVLSGDRRVAKFEFAPRNQGGTGVTIAEFTP